MSSPSPAAAYDEYLVPALFEPCCDVLMARARPLRGERALDVACGTGVVTRRLAELVGPGGGLAALDLNPQMVEMASGRQPPLPAVDWRVGSGLDLPFAEGSFDLVTCQQGLQFFPDRAQGLREMHRVLAAGGRVALAVWGSEEDNPLYKAANEVTRDVLGFGLAEAPFSLSDQDELHALMEGAGFDVQSMETERLQAKFPHPERWISMSVLAAMAAIPSIRALPQRERDAIEGKVAARMQPSVDARVVDGMVVSPMSTAIAIGRR